MSKILPSHPCPICSNPVRHWERYPLAVCPNCDRKACNERGQKLVFFNLSIGGGFGAIVADTKEDYLSHICYIEGKKCWADETRFGGIVIQSHTTQSFDREGLIN